MKTLHFINNEVKHKNDAKNTFDNVDRAFEFYNQTHSDTKISLPYRPVLEDLTNRLQNIIIMKLLLPQS